MCGLSTTTGSMTVLVTTPPLACKQYTMQYNMQKYIVTMGSSSAMTAVQAFFDDQTGTVSYVIADVATSRAAIVDPMLGFDFESGHTSTVQADEVIVFLA